MPTKEQFLKKVAQRVREIRLKAGYSQEDVYFESGIHVGRIELGNRDISITTLHKLCLFFDVSPGEFFKGIW
jgi:transcriptional regulator with XRE-family HTH domain